MSSPTPEKVQEGTNSRELVLDILMVEFSLESTGTHLSWDKLTDITGWSREELEEVMEVASLRLQSHYCVKIAPSPGGYTVTNDSSCPVCGVGTFKKKVRAAIDYSCDSCGDATEGVLQALEYKHEWLDGVKDRIEQYARGPKVDWES
jgi:hypothetical protein